MKIQHVAFNYVHQVWPEISEYLKAAVEKQQGVPDYTLEQVKVYVTTGQWLLLVAVDDESIVRGAATVELFNRPSHRVAFVTCAGGRLMSNLDSAANLKLVLKGFGATSIECAANGSTERLWQRLGFTEKYKILEVTI
jgi:hypothetical protein